MRLFYLLLLLWACPAATQNIHQQLYWFRLSGSLRLDQQWSLRLEADERRLICPDRQAQFIAHFQVAHRLNEHWELGLTQTFSAVMRGALSVPEWRPSGEASYSLRTGGRWRWIQRVRMEARWLHRNDGKVLTDGYRLRGRFRYRLQAEYRLRERLLLRANDEIMYHLDEFDQNRCYLSFVQQLNKHISFELGYLKIIQARSNSDGFNLQDVLRGTVYWRG